MRPRDAAGKVRRALASELIVERATADRKIKALDKEPKALVTVSGSLMALQGIGPATAARLIGEVGDIARFPMEGHFASWNVTALIDALSGKNNRRRLSRSGNRRLNRVLHIMAIVHLRNDTEGRRYFDRKKASGKSSVQAMRCLKRRLSDVVYRQMVADAKRKAAAIPTPDEAAPNIQDEALRRAWEDTWGRLLTLARSARTSMPAFRISHFPGPPRCSSSPALRAARPLS